MAVYVRPVDQGTRVGFVAGRRVGGAVERNRARRLLRESWRSLAGGARSGFDVVFMALPRMQGSKMADVATEMRQILAEAGVIPE